MPPSCPLGARLQRCDYFPHCNGHVDRFPWTDYVHRQPVLGRELENALRGLFRSDGSAVPAIELGLERDPTFVLGHCLRAGALVLSGERHASWSTGQPRFAAIERNAGANERERRHAAGARRWLGGNVARAARHLWRPPQRLSARPAGAARCPWPRTSALVGVTSCVIASPGSCRIGARAIPSMDTWSACMRSHWRRPEATIWRWRRRTGLSSSFPTTCPHIHVIAHVLEMRGSADKGIAWLRATQPVWSAQCRLPHSPRVAPRALSARHLRHRGRTLHLR